MSTPPAMAAMPAPAEDALQTAEVPIDVDAEGTPAPDTSDAEEDEDEEEEEDTHEDEDDEDAAPALALRLARVQTVLVRVEVGLDPLEEVCRDTLGLLAAEERRRAEFAAIMADARAALATYQGAAPGALKRGREEDGDEKEEARPRTRLRGEEGWACKVARTGFVVGLGAVAAWSALAFA